MRDILTVFAFTLRDNIRKKTFIITTIITLVLILGACLAPTLVKQLTNKETPGTGADAEKKYTCIILAKGDLLPGIQPLLAEAFTNIRFEMGVPSQYDEYKARVEKDKKQAVLEVFDGEVMPSLRFTVTDFMAGVPTDGIAKVIHTVIVSKTFAQENVSMEAAKIAMTDISYETVTAGKMDVTGYALGIFLTILVFFAVYFYGYGVAMSVASEKTSRVMETLIVSARPARILLGKCLAMGALGLIQLSLFLVVGGLGYTFLVPEGFTIGGMPLALSSFTVSSALLILVYFLLGYALYAMINSVCGASVSRAEDLNSAMMPAVMISMISFYSAYVVMFLPDPTVRRIVSCIPFTSPFILPFRLLNESVPASDIVISIALLLVAIVIVAAISIRIYTASVLHYGQRLKLKELWHMRAK